MSTRSASLKNVTVIRHPLVQHNLTRLRNAKTGSEDFRRGIAEVAALMVYEATRSFPTKKVRVQTPLAKADGLELVREVILVPVLRCDRLAVRSAHRNAHEKSHTKLIDWPACGILAGAAANAAQTGSFQRTQRAK